jgi:hypothetical protein
VQSAAAQRLKDQHFESSGKKVFLVFAAFHEMGRAEPVSIDYLYIDNLYIMGCQELDI